MDIDTEILKSTNTQKIIDFRKKWLELEKNEIKIMVAIEILANYGLAFRGRLSTLAKWLGYKGNTQLKPTLENLKNKELLMYIDDGLTYTITITEKARKSKVYCKLAKEWIETLKKFNKNSNNDLIDKNLSVDWAISLKLLMLMITGELEEAQSNNENNTLTIKNIARLMNISESQVKNGLKAVSQVDMGILEIDRKTKYYINGTFITCLGMEYTSKLDFNYNEKNK